jgi:hypothetical protein
MDAQPIKTRIDTLINDLCEMTDAVKISDALQSFLTAMSKFHKYSYYNTMSIVLNRPDATKVAGYKTWLTMNRFVRRGEKGIPILAPIIVKQEDPEGNKVARLVNFRVVYVFDISQTDGDPLPDPPEWTNETMIASIHDKLLDFAATQGIEVITKELDNGAEGSSSGGKITLAPGAGTSVLVHEIAHELLHREKIPVSQDVRQRREVEAESVAFIVCAYFGYTASSSPNYLALWAAEPKTIRASLAVIQKAASLIIESINPSESTEKPQ